LAKIEFDYSKLKGLIKEKCDTQKALAQQVGLSEPVMSGKLAGRCCFSQQDIFKIADALEIPAELLSVYFFTPRVRKV
jgi:transcriptional regulator with XRE-family HTH domain